MFSTAFRLYKQLVGVSAELPQHSVWFSLAPLRHDNVVVLCQFTLTHEQHTNALSLNVMSTIPELD